MDLLLGIDLGTSYFKVGLFDRTGTLAGLGRVPVVKSEPAAGWCELPVPAFWELLRRALGEALTAAHATAADIVGCSYSSQANTFVVLDEHDQPLTPLIFWTDERGGVPPEFVAFCATDEFQRTVGFRGIAAGSAVTKWRWLREQQPRVWARARRLLTISDYFAYALTGEEAGDASTAALLGMYDLAGRRWWAPALEVFGVEAEKLVEPLRPGTPRGRTTAPAQVLLGLRPDVAFAVGALDHHAAAIGAGLDLFAEGSISTGTVLAAICLVPRIEPIAGCFHGPHVDGQRYYRLAFDPNGAGQLERLQQCDAPQRTIEDLVVSAARLARGTRPAGERPATGWGAHTEAAVRAVLDDIAETQARLVAMLSDGVRPRTISATGGGARSAAWLQIKADVLGMTVVTPAAAERACLGAAVFAAVAAGMYPDFATAGRAMVRQDREFRPSARGAEARGKKSEVRGLK